MEQHRAVIWSRSRACSRARHAGRGPRVVRGWLASHRFGRLPHGRCGAGLHGLEHQQEYGRAAHRLRDASPGAHVTIAGMPARVIESRAVAALPGGEIAYVLRRNPRSRGVRLTVDPRRGLVVSIPRASTRGWLRAEESVEGFLRERETWIRRHLAKLDQRRAEQLARGGLRDGATIRYRGSLHRLKIIDGASTAGRSSVAREGLKSGDEIVVRLATKDSRRAGIVLESWLRDRATDAIGRAIAAHATALNVQPSRVGVRDPRTRWGSAARTGALSFSWRLILAPPEALETVVVHELAHLRVFGHGPRFWDLVASRRPDHLEWRRWLRRHSHELHSTLDE